MKSHRIKSLLSDTDFLSMVDLRKATLTKKVMSKSISEDERQATLAEYHGLDSFMAFMRSEAQNAKED